MTTKKIYIQNIGKTKISLPYFDIKTEKPKSFDLMPQCVVGIEEGLGIRLANANPTRIKLFTESAQAMPDLTKFTSEMAEKMKETKIKHPVVNNLDKQISETVENKLKEILADYNLTLKDKKNIAKKNKSSEEVESEQNDDSDASETEEVK